MKNLSAAAVAAGILAAVAFSQSASADVITISESQTLPAPFLTVPDLTSGTYGVFTTSTADVVLSPWFGTKYDGSPYSALNAGGGINPSYAIYNEKTGTTSVSFLWGSPDSYNSVELFGSSFGQVGAGPLLITFTGSQLSLDTPGSGYDFVTFTDITPGQTIGSIELINAGTAAFEYSNVPGTGNLSSTPLPGALPLFAGGLALFAMFGLRRRQNGSAMLAA